MAEANAMTTFLILVIAIIISTIAIAFVLSRHSPEDSIRPKINVALRFITGPFPLSVSFHVIILLLLITVHESRCRELIMVNLEAGGGGGSELHDLGLSEVPTPEMASQKFKSPPSAVDTTVASALADSYDAVLAKAGGGSRRSLSHETKINQQVLVLAFGDKWEEQLKFFSRR
jgi:hypothetical protein